VTVAIPRALSHAIAVYIPSLRTALVPTHAPAVGGSVDSAHCRLKSKVRALSLADSPMDSLSARIATVACQQQREFLWWRYVGRGVESRRCHLASSR